MAGTFCGLSGALSVTVTLAPRVPERVGENCTLILQEAPTARVLEPLGQVFVWMKSPGLAPVNAMLLILSGAVPILLNVTVCMALVVPTFTKPKFRLLGFRPINGAAAACSPSRPSRSTYPDVEAAHPF